MRQWLQQPGPSTALSPEQVWCEGVGWGGGCVGNVDVNVGGLGEGF